MLNVELVKYSSKTFGNYKAKSPLVFGFGKKVIIQKENMPTLGYVSKLAFEVERREEHKI